jgi:hypothetical protein
MAVALGEHLNDGRALWIFHNEHRPLCLIDLRQTMGQFFFCSTQEIFRAAVDEAKLPKSLIPMNQGVIKLPPDHVYHFRLKDTGEIDWEMFKINRTRKYGYWETPDDAEEDLPKGERLIRQPVEIITKLDEQEAVIEDREENGIAYDNEDSNRRRVKISSSTSIGKGFNPLSLPTQTIYDDYDDGEDDTNNIASNSDDVVQLCNNSIDQLRAISVTVQNSVAEGSMTEYEVATLIDNLTDIMTDIENTKHTIR